MCDGDINRLWLVGVIGDIRGVLESILEGVWVDM